MINRVLKIANHYKIYHNIGHRSLIRSHNYMVRGRYNKIYNRIVGFNEFFNIREEMLTKYV